MDAYLFEGAPKTVQILPEAVAMGGSWEGNVGRAVPIAWESHLVKRVYEFLAPLDSPVMVDVGANTGSYALLPALLPKLHVYAYEPNPEDVWRVLNEHIWLNRINRKVHRVNAALMDYVGKAELSVPATNAGGCATLGQPVRFTPEGLINIPVDKLDNNPIAQYADKRRNHLDFLKIDTEGAEKFVLQGAKETIAKYKPTMLIECQPMNTAAFGYDPAETLALVESYGYKVEWCSGEDIWCVPL